MNLSVRTRTTNPIIHKPLPSSEQQLQHTEPQKKNNTFSQRYKRAHTNHSTTSTPIHTRPLLATFSFLARLFSHHHYYIYTLHKLPQHFPSQNNVTKQLQIQKPRPNTKKFSASNKRSIKSCHSFHEKTNTVCTLSFSAQTQQHQVEIE